MTLSAAWELFFSLTPSGEGSDLAASPLASVSPSQALAARPSRPPPSLPSSLSPTPSCLLTSLKRGERSLLRGRLLGIPLREVDAKAAPELRAMGLLKGWALTPLGRQIAPFCKPETRKPRP